MPRNFNALFDQAAVDYQSGNLENARRKLQHVLAAQPRNAAALGLLAITLLALGEIDKSLRCFEKIVKFNPTNVDAWSNLAFAQHKLRNFREAVAASDKAISLDAGCIEAWLNRSNSFLELGDYVEALKSCDQAIKLDSNIAKAWYNRGNAYRQIGEHGKALESYDKAISLHTGFIEAWSSRGSALWALGRVADAVASFDQAIILRPDYSEAWINRGTLFYDQNDYDQALDSYNKAISLTPTDGNAWAGRGNTLRRLNRIQEAMASYDRAISNQPDNAEAWLNRGNLLKYVEHFEGALDCYEKAITLKPDFPEALSNRGTVLQALGDFQTALASYDKAISLKPNYAEAWSNRGITLENLHQLDQALASFDKAISIKPDHPYAWSNRGKLLTKVGQGRLAEASYREAIRLDSDYLEAHSNLLFCLNYFEKLSTPKIGAEAARFGNKVSKNSLPKFSSWSNLLSLEKLRIGFVSGDLCTHPVGYFIEGLLEHLDRDCFEVYAFPTTSTFDSLTGRIRSLFGEWIPIYGMTDRDAATLIHKKGVNLLIDLSGHTANNRLGVFSYKPTPVQISWLGYFATTGLPEMDYFLGDPHLAPPEEDHHFTEKLWRLNGPWFCLKPPIEAPAVGNLPALKNGHVTYGSFGNLSKMNDEVVEVWSDVLRKVPTAKLLLKSSQLGDQGQIEITKKRFQKFDLASERLILEGPESRKSYFEAYQRVDFVLDTFPYPGGTTSMDALWMGVPVLTLKGHRFLSHLGETIAINSGNSDWIASDVNDYVSKAIRFASNLAWLSELRSTLRTQALQSPLFDTPRFAAAFGDALKGMWEKTGIPIKT